MDASKDVLGQGDGVLVLEDWNLENWVLLTLENWSLVKNWVLLTLENWRGLVTLRG